MRGKWWLAMVLIGGCKAAAVSETGDATVAEDVAADSAIDSAADASATTWQSKVVATSAVSLFYSQGIARVAGGWAFSAKAGLWRTDDAFQQVVEKINPLPQNLLDAGYGHIGDIDQYDGKLYAGLEQGDTNIGKQAVAWFDPQTLAFLGTVDLPQHECPCLCIDDATGIAYTPDRYHGTDIRRYDVKNGWKPLAPLMLSQKLDAMQGIDAADGALWFSCENETHSLYRADLATGAVVEIGSVGHMTAIGTTMPEVEGIDATHTGTGFLHVLTNEPLQATSWVDDFSL